MRATDVVRATDVPATSRATDRDCSGGSVCDHLAMRCVRRLTSAECAGGQVCVNRACVAPAACTTSRVRPGLVCDASAGRCAERTSDTDRTRGSICREGSCVAPPLACTSSRMCSAFDRVCDSARSWL